MTDGRRTRLVGQHGACSSSFASVRGCTNLEAVELHGLRATPRVTPKGHTTFSAAGIVLTPAGRESNIPPALMQLSDSYHLPVSAGCCVLHLIMSGSAA